MDKRKTTNFAPSNRIRKKDDYANNYKTDDEQKEKRRSGGGLRLGTPATSGS